MGAIFFDISLDLLSFPFPKTISHSIFYNHSTFSLLWINRKYIRNELKSHCRNNCLLLMFWLMVSQKKIRRSLSRAFDLTRSKSCISRITAKYSVEWTWLKRNDELQISWRNEHLSIVNHLFVMWMEIFQFQITFIFRVYLEKWMVTFYHHLIHIYTSHTILDGSLSKLPD